MIALLSVSTVMLPLKLPCTESRRNKLARFSRSPSRPPRTTIARNRRGLLEVVRSISRRARIRPIRPNPYSTTSRGSSRTDVLEGTAASCVSTNLRRLAGSFSTPSRRAWWASLPMSMRLDPGCSSSRTSSTGVVSATVTTSSTTKRASRWALRMSTVEPFMSLRPNTVMMTPRSRYRAPTVGIMRSAAPCSAI